MRPFNNLFVTIRVLFLLACSVWLIMSPLSNIISMRGQTPSFPPAPTAQEQQELSLMSQRIEDEHRFSVLETKMDAIDQRTEFLQDAMWGLVAGMLGLLGERGVSVMRERKKFGGND